MILNVLHAVPDRIFVLQ